MLPNPHPSPSYFSNNRRNLVVWALGMGRGGLWRSTLFLVHLCDLDLCRVGKRGGSWEGLVDAGNPRGLMSSDGRRGLSAEVSWQPAETRPLLTLLPRWKSFSTKLSKTEQRWRRIGRSEREKGDGSVALLEGKTHKTQGLFWGLDNSKTHNTLVFDTMNVFFSWIRIVYVVNKIEMELKKSHAVRLHVSA